MKELPINQVLCGDAFSILPSFPKGSVDMVMFSPPYWGLRDYKVKKVPAMFAKGGLGLEPHPQQYVERMLVLGRLLRRVLKKQGSMYVNLGDTYCGGGVHKAKHKNPGLSKSAKTMSELEPQRLHGMMDNKWLQPKQKLMIPARVAIALQQDGWILRNDIIWHKPNHMPSSVKDRLTSSYEHIFHFVRSRRYFYDLDAIRQPHKNPEEMQKYHVESRLKKAKRFSRRESEFQQVPIEAPHRGSKDVIGRYEGDTITTKHDLAVGRLGDFAYTDPLHTKAEHPRGKNPADVIKIGSHHGSSLTKGRATHYEGQLIESDPKGKNPADVIKTREAKEPFFGHPPTNYYRMGESPMGKNPSDFWSINTKPFPQAHFAVYPVEICKLPILSSCPDQICVGCGKPRKRITKTTKPRAHGGVRNVGDRTDGYTTRLPSSPYAEKEFVGFSECGCNKGFQPGIVLDPMCGSGSTLIAAHKLGRRFIGIDLNPSYVEMAKKRIERECSEWLSKFMEN